MPLCSERTEDDSGCNCGIDSVHRILRHYDSFSRLCLLFGKILGGLARICCWSQARHALIGKIRRIDRELGRRSEIF